jgi:hypothetical protein
MLSIAPPTSWLHSGGIGMRTSFNGLSGIIRGTFGGDPADGSFVLVVNKRRDRINALWWHGDGYMLWYKRLEEGTFETVPSPAGEDRVRIAPTPFGDDPWRRTTGDGAETQAIPSLPRLKNLVPRKEYRWRPAEKVIMLRSWRRNGCCRPALLRATRCCVSRLE